MAEAKDILSGSIYGTLSVGVLLAAESSSGHTFLETLGASLVAVVGYWLAHAYAHSLAGRLATSEHPYLHRPPSSRCVFGVHRRTRVCCLPSIRADSSRGRECQGSRSDRAATSRRGALDRTDRAKMIKAGEGEQSKVNVELWAW